jgi:ubiquinone/menaquinone biosynthesis C-methylase UbiE
MSATFLVSNRSQPGPLIDLAAVKVRQQAAWSAGDFAAIGVTLQIVGETLCEAIDLRAGERVLDVAAGNGNATLAAARRFADVTSTDYVPALLERSQARAEAERLPVAYQVADAEALPFPNASFDVVLSTFGVMFTADHARAAREMLRVCRPGGRIGMANWTPEGFIGQLFKVVGRHVPPPAGAPSPAFWGTGVGLEMLFGDGAASIAATERTFVFRYRSPQHWVDMFRTWYGPVLKAFAALNAQNQAALEEDILALLARFNCATDGSLAAPAAYLEVVVTTRASEPETA